MVKLAKKCLLKVGVFGLSVSIVFTPVQAKAADDSRLTLAQQSFINEIAGHAQSVQKEHGILASITISQAILESNWGQSKLAKLGHNLFGIKGAYQGSSVSMPTKEHDGEEWIGTNARFRAYPNWYESLTDHAQLFAEGPSWNRQLYSGLIHEKDYRKSAQALDRAGYSSDPHYADKLIALIEKFNLTRFDQLDSEKSSEKTIQAIGYIDSAKKFMLYERPNGKEKVSASDYLQQQKIALVREYKQENDKTTWYFVDYKNGLRGWLKDKAFTKIEHATASKQSVSETKENVNHELFQNDYTYTKLNRDTSSDNQQYHSQFVISLISLMQSAKLSQFSF